MSWVVERERGQWTCLSHLSLEFRQGSQLIALRARFVGGRPSALSEPGGGEVRCRTVLIVDRAALDRTVEGVMDRWSSAMAWGWEGEGVGARTPHIYRYLIIYFLPPLPGVPTKAASPPPASTGHLPGLGGRGSERFGDQVRETEHSRGHIRPESAAVENVKRPAITCEISVLHSKSIPPRL